MSEKNVDPELRDDRDVVADEDHPVELPDFDDSQFELPDDFEDEEDDGLEEGDK